MGKYDLEESALAPIDAQEAITSGARDNVIVRSLRGGVLGAGSQLVSLAAGVGEFKDMAREGAVSKRTVGQLAYAKELQAKAQLPENSPRISSFKALRENPTLSNAGEYVGGLLGGSLPMSAVAVGAGVLSGGRAIPAMLAGGAALTPFETGDVLSRMQTDPEALRMGSGERLIRASGAGAASAAAQGIVPGIVAGKLTRAAGAGAVGRPAVSTVAGNLGGGALIEGAAEGAGETIKQLGTNFDKPLDWEQVGENAIGGAVAGGALGTVGAAADLTQGRGAGAVDAIKSGATSIRERVAARMAAAEPAPEAPVPAPKKFNSLGDDVNDLFARGRAAFDDSADRVMKGQPLGDLKEFATAQGSRLKEMMSSSDNETVKKMQEWGSQMMSDASLSPERKQAVAAAMANVSDRASQTAMAGLKTAYDAGNAMMNKVNALHNAFKKRDVEGDVREITTPRIGDGDITDVTPIKKSEDYSGANKAIADQLGPMLAKSQPELVNRPEALNSVANNVREAVTQMSSKSLASDAVFRLIDMLGTDTAATLDKAFKTLADTDPVKAEGFYKHLNELADVQQRSRTLNDLVSNSLVPESQNLIKSSQIGELVQMLVARARGEGVDPNAGPNQRTAQDREFREFIATHFGDKADAMSLAIEKEAGLRTAADNTNDELINIDDNGAEVLASEGGFDESGRRISAESLDVIRKGYGPKNDLVMDPALFKSRGMQGQNYASQYMKDMQAKYPDYDVRFEKAEGTDGLGHVVAEKAANPDALSDADVQAMRLDTKKYANSPDRLELTPDGGEKIILDTRRIAKAMKRIPRAEGTTDAQHLANRFIEGLARLTEQHGSVDVADSVVIGQIGHKDFTFGMAKALDPRTAADKDSDAARAELEALEESYYLSSDPKEREALKIEGRNLRVALQDKKNDELARGEDAQGRSLDRPPAVSRLTRAVTGVKDRAVGVRRSDNGVEENDGGARNPSKDAQIHEAASKLKANDLVNRSNMDGTPRHTGDRVNETRNSLVLAVAKWGRVASAPSQSIANRARTLLASIEKMTEKDRHQFIQLGGMPEHKFKGKTIPAVPAASLSEASETINELARKYRDVIVPPKNVSTKMGKTGDKGSLPAERGRPVAEDNLRDRRQAELDHVFGEKSTALSAKTGKQPVFSWEGASKTDKRGIDELVDEAILKDTYPSTAKGAERFLKAAKARYVALYADMNVDAPAHDKKVYEALNQTFAPDADLGMFFSETNDFSSLPEAEQDRLIAFAESLNDIKGKAPGSTPSPKAPAAKKAAASSGDKQSVERMRQEFPELTLRQPTTDERAQIDAVLQKLSDNLGSAMPQLVGVSVRDGERAGFAARAVTREDGHHIVLSKELFGEITTLLGSTADKVERAFTHEVGHLFDRDKDNFSDDSELFVPGGELHAEIKKYADASAKAGDRGGYAWFNYALNAVRTPHRELFAQAFSLFHYNPESMREALPKNYQFFQDQIGRGEGRPAATGRAELSGASNQSVADKEAGLLEAAKSSDPALLKELSTSDDAKGLQRAAEALYDIEGADDALQAANTRLSELMEDPDVAYGMQTKKYSMDGARIHEESGNEGFGATHDSPHRHEGKFDWRAHQGKGEGQAAFGAGTYLSTADGVHKSYKNQFTAKATDAALKEDKRYQRLLSRGRELEMELSSTVEREQEDRIQEEIYANEADIEEYLDGKKLKSPTYEVSVNIKAEQLLDWDKPLNEQSKFVQKALRDAGIDKADIWNKDFETDPSPTGKYIYQHIIEANDSKAEASEFLQSIGILGHRYAASGGKNDTHPNFVIYDDSKISTNYVHFSAQTTGTGTHTAAQRAEVKAYIEKVLGKSVRKGWANLTHAGDFDSATDTIRVSVHALDPLSVAYHESLHAFFAQLRRAGATDITSVLERAAESAHVLEQLTAIFANQPAVLAQLKNPEERAAYMYQMWAAGKLTVGPQAKGVFRKIADYIRNALGIWSNDERALHIMDYFHSGEYAQNMGSPSVVREALMGQGNNKALDRAKELTEPLVKLADSMFGMGSARLRDTEIPALMRLANLIKRESTDAAGGDQGFIAAARIERTQRVNAFSEAVADYTPDQLKEATVALQRGEKAASPEARLAQRAIKKILAETKAYMEKAGVELGDLGPDYFPRVWDVHYISKNQDAFKQMLEPYKRAGTFTGSAESLVASLIARDGNEFGVETREPGMQYTKRRVLSFIDPKDAAAFVKADLFSTMDSYLSQAARKAEWERRLGGDKLARLFADAKRQGATEKDLKLADKYLRGVDGTLGDAMDPGLRRLSGNILVYQNIRLLPLAVFSSIVDPVGVMVRGGTVTDAWATFTRGIREISNTFKKDGGTRDTATELAELMGVIDTASLSHFMGDVYTQGMVGGTAQKINNAFFKYNLMEGFNRSFRVGATQAALKFIATHADGTASTHSKRWINELGLRAGDVVAQGDRIALTEAEGLTAAQAVRVRAAINQWVDGAILRPDSADKPIWMNDPHYALIAHLKQFIYSFQKTILTRVAHEFKHGNYTPAMALAGYVPIMIAADLVKGTLQGGGDQPEWKKNWGVTDHVAYGVQRAGLLGVGEFPLDALQDIQRGGSGVGALLGPTVEQLADAVQVVGGRKEFSSFALKAMPANALYAEAVRGDDSTE